MLYFNPVSLIAFLLALSKYVVYRLWFHRFGPFFCHSEAAADTPVAPEQNKNLDPQAPEEASSSGLDSGPVSSANGHGAEPGISQSDSENKDPSSNTGPEEVEYYPRKRGRPSKRFLRKKYKKYLNRK